MILLRYVALPTGIVNTLVMVMAAVSGEGRDFLLAWVGAVFGFYACLFYQEEQDVTLSGYLDLARRLAWEIREKDYRPGDRLPTTKDIAEAYGTTRTTVARAIKVLAEENVVRPIRGRGVYVMGPGGAIGLRTDKLKDRIEQHITHQLDTAEPGAPMPSTHQLSALFNVHEVTVRRVQAELVDQGLLKRSRNGNYFKA